MATFLPQNKFMDSAPARTSPDAGDAAAMRPPPVPAAADFPNPVMPTAGSAVPSDLPPVIGGTAAPFSDPVAKATKGKAGTAEVNGLVRRSTAGTGLRVGEASADLPATSEFMDVTARRDEHSIYEPTSSTGGPQEAPAGSAPNTAAPAGALGDRLDWHEFWNAITDERIVLFEPFDEHPLFIIEDGSLQRWEA